MGCYVNPPGGEKEEWLFDHSIETSTPCAVTKEFVPVCLVDNGEFTAAGVCFDENEVRVFNNPKDFRPKWWFKVAREKLYAVSDLKEYE